METPGVFLKTSPTQSLANRRNFLCWAFARRELSIVLCPYQEPDTVCRCAVDANASEQCSSITKRPQPDLCRPIKPPIWVQNTTPRRR